MTKILHQTPLGRKCPDTNKRTVTNYYCSILFCDFSERVHVVHAHGHEKLLLQKLHELRRF